MVVARYRIQLYDRHNSVERSCKCSPLQQQPRPLVSNDDIVFPSTGIHSCRTTIGRRVLLLFLSLGNPPQRATFSDDLNLVSLREISFDGCATHLRRKVAIKSCTGTRRQSIS